MIHCMACRVYSAFSKACDKEQSIGEKVALPQVTKWKAFSREFVALKGRASSHMQQKPPQLWQQCDEALQGAGDDVLQAVKQYVGKQLDSNVDQFVAAAQTLEPRTSPDDPPTNPEDLIQAGNTLSRCHIPAPEPLCLEHFHSKVAESYAAIDNDVKLIQQYVKDALRWLSFEHSLPDSPTINILQESSPLLSCLASAELREHEWAVSNRAVGRFLRRMPDMARRLLRKTFQESLDRWCSRISLSQWLCKMDGGGIEFEEEATYEVVRKAARGFLEQGVQLFTGDHVCKLNLSAVADIASLRVNRLGSSKQQSSPHSSLFSLHPLPFPDLSHVPKIGDLASCS